MHDFASAPVPLNSMLSASMENMMQYVAKVRGTVHSDTFTCVALGGVFLVVLYIRDVTGKLSSHQSIDTKHKRRTEMEIWKLAFAFWWMFNIAASQPSSEFQYSMRRPECELSLLHVLFVFGIQT